MLIVWRTRRNRLLLEHLQKLPTADRLRALTAEMGHVELAHGISPEQWLKSRIYMYLLVGWLIVCGTIVLVASMALVHRPAKPTVDLTLYEGVSLDDKMAAEDELTESDPYTTLKYAYTREDNHIRLIPTMPYLDDVAAGHFVSELFDFTEMFRSHFPELSFKIANNTVYTQFVTEIIVHVTESTPDLTPILYISDLDPKIEGNFLINNDGWGAVHHPELYVGFSDSCEGSPDKLHAHEIKPFNEEHAINISSAVPKVLREYLFRPIVELVCNTNGCTDLEKALLCHSSKDDCCISFSDENLDYVAQVRDAAEKDGQIVREWWSKPDRGVCFRVERERPVCVFGDLSFRSISGIPGKFKFKTYVHLGDLQGDKGAPSAPSYRYHLQLTAGKAGYIQGLAVAQTLKSGETDHFLVKVGTDKSAFYKLRLDVMGNDATLLQSFFIDMHLILPVSNSRRPADRPEPIGGMSTRQP